MVRIFCVCLGFIFETMAHTVNKKRVAIIGSGIAGLTTAFILSQAGHDVEIFEREAEVIDYATPSKHRASRHDFVRVFSRS